MFGKILSPIRRLYQLVEINLFSAEDDLTQLDPEVLKELYRNSLFVKAIVNITASFVFPQPPKIECEDKTAEEILNKIWQDNYELLITLARDASLTGNAYLKIGYKNGIDLLEVYPSKVQIIPVPTDIREYEKIRIFHILPSFLENTPAYEITEEYTKQTIKIYQNGQLYSQIENPIKEIPVVHIAYNRFSNELFGTGDINEAVYSLISQYERVLSSAVKNFEYHGQPMPVAKVEDIDVFAEQIKKQDWKKQKMLTIGKDEDVKFLEATNISSDARTLLEVIFYNIVILSETPEFLMGVHTPSSYASTKMQMHPIVRKTKRYQSTFKEKLKEANRLILKSLEMFENYKFSTYETTVNLEPPDQKDIEIYTKSVSQLVSAGIITAEEGKELMKEVLPQIINDETEEPTPNNWEEYENAGQTDKANN